MEETKILPVDRKYRDTVFRILFGEDKNNAMSLYEAISGKTIEKPEDFEFTTLKDVIFMKLKNDVSFIVDSRLVLFEHQSTFNPNMPLRGLMYCAELYKTLYHNRQIYSSKRIDILAPEYVVFYNGSDKYFPDDRMELRLSDSFADKSLSSKYEWTALMININKDHNASLMEKCAALEGYSFLVQKIVEFQKDAPMAEAVRHAMECCIEKGFLVEFLKAHMEEVFNMCLTEFNETEYIDLVREEGREEGRQEGREEGRQEGREEGREEGRQEGREEGEDRMISLFKKLFSEGRLSEIARIESDLTYRKQLLKEYSLD